MDSNPGADQGSKSRKRVITETRREQNRAAQTAYRKRQKEKRLQKYAQNEERRPKDKLELRPKQPSNDAHLSNGSFNIHSQPPINESTSDTTPQTRPSPLLAGTSPSTSYHHRIHAVDNSRLYPLPILSSNAFFPSIDYSCQNDTVDSGLQLIPGTPDFDDFQRDLSSGDVLSTANEAFDIPERDEVSKSSFDHLGQVEISAPITSDFLSKGENNGVVSPSRSLPATASILQAHRQEGINHDVSTWDVTMSPAAQHTGLEEIIAAGMQVLLFNRPPFPSKSIELTMASFSLPSPYINVIDTRRTRTLTACLHNARSMGFATCDVLKPHCIALSLIFRPHSPGDDYEALVASATNPNTPAHLQPTLPQVLYQHPAFLDLIPIPGFRSKVILAAVRKGWDMIGMGGLDLFDLKRDMFQDGLVWRSCDGYGDQGNKGQPWDMRSWEASGWFANKWRALVDDDVHVSRDT